MNQQSQVLMRPRRLVRGAIAMTILLLIGACTTEYRMGDVIKADPNANANAQASTAPNTKKNTELEPWNEKWRQIVKLTGAKAD